MQLPARIGKYELEEFLGGGMSHVYRARDTVIGRTVAVKILTEAGCEDEEVKARFLAEARMAGSLAHDNILGIYDFGEDDQRHPFMVMEFLRGEDLRHAIRNGHTGDLTGKLKIAVQVARALGYIHSQKIVHRDIKPENVHINTAGVVKLMDFGIAKTEGLAMTRAGYVLGTPYYMSPEQVMGQDITEQVDVYAFGILLFELMTGTKPISGDAVERIFYSILNEPLNLDPLRQTGASQAVCELVAHCTVKKAQDRPQGFAPVIAELERMIAEQEAPTMVLPLPVPPPPPRPAWVLPAILAVVLALAAGLYFAMQPKALAPTLATSTGEMMLVPAGDFLFGKDKVRVSLPAYYVDKTEVTNAAYERYCKEASHPLPPDFPSGKADFPVVNITILDALAYAKWAGKRLPNAKEWEKAARGTDGRTYPWGEQANPALANVGTGELQPAAALPAGASPSGALNMLGNVWELVEQEATPGPIALKYFNEVLSPPPSQSDTWYVIRGQSYGKGEQLEPAAIFDSGTTVPARWKNTNIGFRCVRDPK